MHEIYINEILNALIKKKITQEIWEQVLNNPHISNNIDEQKYYLKSIVKSNLEYLELLKN